MHESDQVRCVDRSPSVLGGFDQVVRHREASGLRARPASQHAPVDGHRLVRLSLGGGEVELAGPPAALRALARRLRDRVEPVEVRVTGGTVSQRPGEYRAPQSVSLVIVAEWLRD
jgi:hypothetical protein